MIYLWVCLTLFCELICFKVKYVHSLNTCICCEVYMKKEKLNSYLLCDDQPRLTNTLIIKSWLVKQKSEQFGLVVLHA